MMAQGLPVEERARALLDALGLRTLEDDLYHRCVHAWRFDIGSGCPYTCGGRPARSYIRRAAQRLCAVYRALPVAPDILAWQCGKDMRAQWLPRFQTMFSLPAPLGMAHTPARAEQEELVTNYWSISPAWAGLEPLFTGIITSELGGWVALSGTVYLLSETPVFLFYPYDDRGADIVAATRETLSAISVFS